MALGWLMLLYRMPTRPSTQRVYVWRRLKACGVLYLQNSVCLLPQGPRHQDALEKLKRDVEARRGEARLLSIRLARAVDDRQIRELFRKQSDEEYEEFLGKCRDYHSELANERAKMHFTFAELDENEAEVDKLRAWLPKIGSRDFFKARLARRAAAALIACERDITRFGREVAERDGPSSRDLRLNALAERIANEPGHRHPPRRSPRPSRRNHRRNAH